MLSTKRAWVAVASMFVLNGALFGIWASRIPAAKDIHLLTHSELGALLLCLAGGAICAFPVAGKLSDQMGAVRVTKISASLYVLALVLLSLAPNFLFLAIALFLFGAFHGAMDVTMNSWAAEVERWAKRPQMSSYHAMFSLGAGFGAGSGYFAISMDATLFQHFVVAGGAVTIAAFFAAQISWVSQTSTTTNSKIFSFPKGALVLVGLIAFGAAMGEGAMADWSAVYLIDIGNAKEEWAAIGYAVFSVTMVIMRFLGDYINRLSPPNVVAAASGLVATAGALTAVFGHSIPSILVGFALMGIGYALIMPLAFSRAANDPETPPGQAIAGVATLGYGGMLLGPPIIGFVASAYSLRISFGLLASLALLVAALSGALRRPD